MKDTIEDVSQEEFNSLCASIIKSEGKLEGSPTRTPGIINYVLNAHGVKAEIGYNANARELTVNVISTPFYLPQDVVVHSLEAAILIQRKDEIDVQALLADTFAPSSHVITSIPAAQ